MIHFLLIWPKTVFSQFTQGGNLEFISYKIKNKTQKTKDNWCALGSRIKDRWADGIGDRVKRWWCYLCCTVRPKWQSMDMFWFARKEARRNSWIHFSKSSQDQNNECLSSPGEGLSCALAPSLVILFFNFFSCFYPSPWHYNYPNLHHKKRGLFYFLSVLQVFIIS